MNDAEFMCYGPEPVLKFLDYHRFTRGHSETTVKGYAREIHLFIRWLNRNGEIPPETFDIEMARSVRKADVYEYLTYMARDLHNSPRTQKRALSAIKSFFNFLSDKTGEIPNIGIDKVDPPKSKNDTIDKFRHKSLEVQDAVDLQNVEVGRYDLRDRAIVSIFLCTGIRLSELAGLNLDSIDFRTGKMIVLGKGGKIRELWLDKVTLEQTKEYFDLRVKLHPNAGHEKALFLSQLGNRISGRRIQEMLNVRLEAAGLGSRGFHPHSLRHTTATLMLRSGVDIKTVSETLGHADTAITGTYLHSNEELIRRATATMSDILISHDAASHPVEK